MMGRILVRAFRCDDGSFISLDQDRALVSGLTIADSFRQHRMALLQMQDTRNREGAYSSIQPNGKSTLLDF